MSRDNVTTAAQVPATRWPEWVGEHVPRGAVEAHAAIKAYERAWTDVHATFVAVMAHGKEADAAIGARAEHIAAVTRAHAAADTAESAIKAARGVVPVPVLGPEPKPAKQPTWWRIEITLHQGVTVIRNVTKRPNAQTIMESGWSEERENGDQFMVGYDSIAVVEITGHVGPIPGGAL